MDWNRFLQDPRARIAIGAGALVVIGLVGWIVVANPFASPPAPSPLAVVSPTPTRAPTATPSPTPPEPTPTETPTPTPTHRPAALKDGRLTILVLGSDSSIGRRHLRGGDEFLTDAITVVTVTANGRRMALFSLP